MGRAKIIGYTGELDADELQRQFKAGIGCGLLTAKGQIVSLEDLEEEFQKSLTVALMAARRDCQASANHAIYGEGYRYGLKIARDKL